MWGSSYIRRQITGYKYVLGQSKSVLSGCMWVQVMYVCVRIYVHMHTYMHMYAHSFKNKLILYKMNI